MQRAALMKKNCDLTAGDWIHIRGHLVKVTTDAYSYNSKYVNVIVQRPRGIPWTERLQRNRHRKVMSPSPPFTKKWTSP